MTRLLFAAVLLSSFSLAPALNISHTSCSLEHANFIAAPDIRGTLDILWTCLSTLLVCVYQVLHLEVPHVPLNVWRSLRRSALWTLIAILLPELILADALNVLCTAIYLRNKLNVQSRERLSLTHLAFANMGGLVVKCKRSDLAGQADDKTSNPNEVLEEFHLTAAFLCLAFETGLIRQEIPSKADITDKSKADVFSTILSVTQLSYFLLQVIVRAANQVPLSQLEVGTAAFVGVAAVTYLAYLPRPKAVSTKLEVFLHPSLPENRRHMLVFGGSNHSVQHFIIKMLSADQAGNDGRTWLRYDNVLFKEEHWSSALVLLASPLLGSAFSAVHFAAWNLDFPNAIELQCWRAATIASTCSLPLCFVGKGACANLDMPEWLGNALLGFFMLVYVLARLVLVVEMFRTLFFLPPEVFQTTWTTNIPHIG